MKLNNLIIPVIVLVAGVAAGFFAGTKYQQGKVAGTSTQAVSGQGRSRFGNGQGFRPTIGEIISSDDKSITVKMADGSTKIVFLSGNTVYEKTDTAASSDLKTGIRVAVIGMTNSDGSITAQTIQINPIVRMNGLGPTPSATPTQ